MPYQGGDKGCLTCKLELTGKEAKLGEELAEAILNIAPARANVEADLLTQPRIEEVVEPGKLKRAGEIDQRIAGSHLSGA